MGVDNCKTICSKFQANNYSKILHPEVSVTFQEAIRQLSHDIGLNSSGIAN
jgi:hypothetical protein